MCPVATARPTAGPSRVHAVTAYQTSTKPFPPCPVCRASHFLSACPQFTARSPHDRRELINKFNRCFNCLSNAHTTLDCSSKYSCRVCHRRHHSLLHEDVPPSAFENSAPGSVDSEVSAHLASTREEPRSAIRDIIGHCSGKNKRTLRSQRYRPSPDRPRLRNKFHYRSDGVYPASKAHPSKYVDFSGRRRPRRKRTSRRASPGGPSLACDSRDVSRRPRAPCAFNVRAETYPRFANSSAPCGFGMGRSRPVKLVRDSLDSRRGRLPQHYSRWRAERSQRVASSARNNFRVGHFRTHSVSI